MLVPILKKAPAAINYITHVDQYNGGWKVTVSDTIGAIIYAGTAVGPEAALLEATTAIYLGSGLIKY